MPIDINTLTYDTPLPVEMATFWPSINNKVKLQSMLIDCIIEGHKFQTVDVVISGIIGHGSDAAVCKRISKFDQNISSILELDLDIEEADVRIMPHTFHAVRHETTNVVLVNASFSWLA